MYVFAAKTIAKTASASSAWLTFLGPILVAVVTGVFALLGAWVKSILDKKKQEAEVAEKKKELEDKRSVLMSCYIQLYSEINHLINAALQDIGAHRILILQVENGGGRPKPGAKIFSTVAWEAFDPPAGTVLKAWQRQPVDGVYVQLLAQMIGVGEIRIKAEEKKVGPIAFNYYKAYNIQDVELHFLHGNESRILYISIAYIDDVDMEDPTRRMRIQVLTNSLKRVLEEMERLEKETR